MTEKLVRCTCPRLGGFDPDCPVSHEKPGAGMRCESPLGVLKTYEDLPGRIIVRCTREPSHPGAHGCPITWEEAKAQSIYTPDIP